MKFAVFVVAFVCLVSLTFAVPMRFGNDKTLRTEFREFTQKYNKQYATPKEFEQRFATFVENKKKVAHLNQIEGEDAAFGVTKFMDMSPQEFKKMYLTARPSTQQIPGPDGQVDSSSLPTTWDWRNEGAITAVKNQGDCGSCWAFSTTETTESAWYIATKNLPTLAPQQIVSCDTQYDGCNGGEIAFNYVQSEGLETETDYPYTSGNTDKTGTCDYNKNDVVSYVNKYGYATTTKNETQMQVYCMDYSPLSVLVDAESWQYYTGGIMTSPACGTDLDHAVQAVGWNTGGATPYWIVRNSWGTDWGYAGYIYVEMYKNECGIAEGPQWAEWTQ